MKTFSLPPIYDVRDVSSAAGSWSFDAWLADRLRSRHDGRGVTVAVLDTGVDETHPELASGLTDVKDFTGSSSGTKDRNGHGTHVTATVGGKSSNIGFSQGCDLIHGKVLGDDGGGGDSGIAAAIRWAKAKGAHIISASFGSSSPSAIINAAIDEFAAGGGWFFAAAGNEAWNGIGHPGAHKSAFSVAAHDRKFKVASFSSRGQKLDISGPGVDIISAKPGGGLANMSGTSMSTPFIAGLFACYRGLLMEKGLRIPNVFELRDLMATLAVDLGVTGDDTDYGPGGAAPLMLAISTTPDPKPIG